MKLHRDNSGRRPAGFTLIEFLVVIAMNLCRPSECWLSTDVDPINSRVFASGYRNTTDKGEPLCVCRFIR
jgi:hypothetical protein